MSSFTMDKSASGTEGRSTATSESSYDPELPGNTVLPAILDISGSDYSVESARVIPGGSFNCVVPATLRLPDGSTKQALFRIPRFAQDEEGHCNAVPEIKDHAAVLSFLRQNSFPFRVPQVLEFDTRAGDANCLRHPYILLDHIPGGPLEDIYLRLSVAQRKFIVQEVVRIRSALAAFTFDGAGDLTAGPNVPENITFDQAGLQVEDLADLEVKGFKRVYGEVEMKGQHYAPAKGLSDLIFSNLERWDAYATRNLELPDVQDMCFQDVRAVAELMEEMGLEQNTSIVMHHWDLYPRNILIKVEGLPEDANLKEARIDGAAGIEITGIIDWDSTQAVPTELTRMPDAWLWCGDVSASESWEGVSKFHPDDADWHTHGQHLCGAPLSPDNQEIKLFYEQLMEKTFPGFHWDAYGRGRSVRILWKLIKEEFTTYYEAREKLSQFATEFLSSFRENINKNGWGGQSPESDSTEDESDEAPLAGSSFVNNDGNNTTFTSGETAVQTALGGLAADRIRTRSGATCPREILKSKVAKLRRRILKTNKRSARGRAKAARLRRKITNMKKKFYKHIEQSAT